MVILSLPARRRSHDTIKRIHITKIHSKNNIHVFTIHIPHRIRHMLLFQFTAGPHYRKDPAGNRERHHDALHPDIPAQNHPRREMADLHGTLWTGSCNRPSSRLICWRIRHNILRMEGTLHILHNSLNNHHGSRTGIREGRQSGHGLSP